MKKTLFILMLAAFSLLNSCKKETYGLEYTFYVAGNELTLDGGDITDSNAIIYQNDERTVLGTHNYYVSDIYLTRDHSYACGSYLDYETQNSYLRIWKDGKESNANLNNREGMLNKILVANDDAVFAVGSSQNKGILIKNGNVILEYGEEGKCVEFKSVTGYNNGQNLCLSIAVDEFDEESDERKLNQKIKVMTVEFKTETPDYTVTEYTDEKMNYGKYEYEVTDITLLFDGYTAFTCLAMNRLDGDLKETGCYSITHNNIYTLESGSHIFSMKSLGNDLRICGQVEDKNSVMRAYLWNKAGVGEDCSEGLDGTSGVLNYFYDGINNDLVMFACGQLQYQFGANVKDVKVDNKFVPSRATMRVRQVVIPAK